MSGEIYSGNPQLKKAHVNIEWTPQLVDEYVKCTKDPVYFAKKYIKIISVDEGVVPFNMYKFQEKLIKTFHKNRFNICKLPRQPLCLSTPLPTPNGWKTIGSIQVGEYVYNPNGIPVKVVKKSQIFYNTECYKFYFDTEDNIVSDEKHLWEIEVNGIVKLLETSEIYELFKDKNTLSIKSAKIPEGYNITENNNPKNKKHFILNIEKVKSTPVSCITVDDDSHLFLCGRNFIPTHNSGKSTTAVSYLLHYAIFNDNVNIAILANKAQTAKDLLARLQLAYENLPKWLQQGVKIWNKASLELDNGSKIIAASTSASSVRGGTYNIIFLDEFAFIPNQIAEEFFRSTYPTITSGKNTKVIIISCVTKDTYLLTPNGYRKIQTLIDEKKKGAYIVPEYTVRGKDKFYKSNIIVNNQKSITNIIKTRYETLECSQDHKLWAFKNGEYEYFKSKDLSVGDYVSIKYNQQIFGDDDYVGYIPIKGKSSNSFSCEYVNEDIAYFIGLYVAEGYARDIFSKRTNELIGGQIVITCGDDISKSLDKLNIRYRKVDDVHYVINSKHLLEFIKLLGFNVNSKAKEKFLPDKVLSWSKANIVALLRGMFDGDGGIDTRGRIGYTSTSRELIRQVQLLLGNLGILGSMYTSVIPPSKIVKVSSKTYTIEIVGKYAFEYFKQIGFNLERKSERISLLKESNRNGSHTDIVPNSSVILEQYGAPKIADRKKDFKNYSRDFLLSNKNLLCSNEKIKEFFEDNVSENLIWLEIKSIEKGENEVFDVSLPDIEGDKWAHSVLYNNFLGHQTPNGMNMYYKLWTEAERNQNEYIPTEVQWNEVPGRDKKFKEQTISNIGLDAWNQEFECSFLGSAGTLISPAKIKTLIYDQPISKSESLDIYKKPEKDRIYLIIADCSEGVGKDYHAFIVFDITSMPYTIAAKYKNNELKPMLLADIIKNTATAYNNAYILIEIASVGEQVAKNIHYDLEYGNLLMSSVNGRAGQIIGQGFYGKNAQYGLKISKQVKRVGCSNLKTIIEDDKILIRDFEIISELTTFISKANSYEAEVGCNDDLVSCLVIFAWLIVQDYFKDLTNNDIRKKLSEEQKESLDLELAPLGFFNDGITEEDKIIDKKTGDIWLVADKNKDSYFQTIDIDPHFGSFNYLY